MIAAIRRHFDRISEWRARQLLEADLPIINRWRVGVAHRLDIRRGYHFHLAGVRNPGEYAA